MTGEQLKQEGIELVATNNPTWTEQAVHEIVRYSRQVTGFFSADEVRKFGGLSEAPNNNCWGAAFKIAANQGHIEHCGYRKSMLNSAHSRVISIWKRK